MEQPPEPGKILPKKFENPLHKFQSYSTHFIMLACRTTEAARYFANNHVQSSAQQQQIAKETLQAIDNVNALGEPVIFNTGTARSDNDVFLVLDTRRFTQFTVDSLKYEVLINGVESAAAHANLATEVEMTILDSVGISFMNYLQWLMDTRMQTNFDGMVFLLRIVFVGHNEDRTTETISSCTIPMHLLSMDLNLDFAKGIYNCKFMPNINFATTGDNARKWLNIGNATTYKTGLGRNTLGDIITSFVNRLNEESARFYNDIADAMSKAGVNPGKHGKFGRRVEYVVTIPKEWSEYEFTGPSVDEAIERNFAEEKKAREQADAAKKKETEQAKKETGASNTEKSTTTHAKSSQVTVSNGHTITQVLDIILNQTEKIKEFANADKLKAKDSHVKFYKYVVGITSTNEAFQVQVHVVPFSVPNAQPPTPEQKQEAIGKYQSEFFQEVKYNGQTIYVPKNFYELDYIFTGKNIDILNFDMKIENLSFLLASNVRVSEGQINKQSTEGQDGKNAEDPKLKNTDLLFARQYDPITIPILSQEEMKSFSNIIAHRNRERMEKAVQETQQYTKNLSTFYANSPIVIDVTIKGNPYIMLKFADESPMPHVAGTTTINTSGQVSQIESKSLVAYREAFEKEFLKLNESSNAQRNGDGTFTVSRPLGDARYYSQPVFFKVNIKGPNVDPRTNELLGGENFAEEVLQQNYYVVFKVTNIIEKGVFSQQLQLYSHNVFGLNKLEKDQMTTRR